MTTVATPRSMSLQPALIVVSQVAALSCWFSASAVAGSLAAALGVGGQGGVLLTSSVQLGFVIGALGSALLNVADRVPPHLLYAGAATAAAACTAVIAAGGLNFAGVIGLRLLTGVALAGVYPVGLKLMASWASPRTRARAIGLLVGGLTLGSAMPQLIRGFPTLPWQGVLWAAAAVTLLGGLIVAALVRPGPNLDQRRGRFEPRYIFRMFGDRLPRLANFGYLGHMWELYALWTWLPVFVLQSQLVAGGSTGSVVNLLSFAAIGIAGMAGCLIGGTAADRFGRAPAAVAALAISGACCLLSPLVFGRALPWLAILVLVWGAAVIADSGVFSTALSETVDQRFVGTALTGQTAFGFLLTTVTIQGVSILAGAVGWRYALAPLALGPLFGGLSMLRFGRLLAAQQARGAT